MIHRVNRSARRISEIAGPEFPKFRKLTQTFFTMHRMPSDDSGGIDQRYCSISHYKHLLVETDIISNYTVTICVCSILIANSSFVGQAVKAQPFGKS